MIGVYFFKIINGLIQTGICLSLFYKFSVQYSCIKFSKQIKISQKFGPPHGRRA